MLDVVNFTEEFEPRPGLKITYVRAGHVLGAASIEVAFDDKLVVFSGDIGREKHILIPSFTPEVKNEADYVVMEALYGGVVHPERGESVNELVRIIQETLADGGSIFIPCFAVQRTQEILYDLKLAKQSGALPNDLPVWLDSPMAQKVTEVYTAALDHAEDSHFNFPGLKYVRNYRTSLKISRRPRQVIIAGSGMADGGRILSHLIANLKNSKNRVIFVGYQAEATIGRAIVDGAHEVMIDKLTVPVKARIHHLHGFSAHGDNDDYVAWLKRYASPKLKKTFLIHADIDRSEALKQNFEQLGLDHPYIPDRRETIQL
jgi:metallo-beta-lactamase family protein